ncbi:hypothetical protein CEXT_569551 [Caerostris extrusa]|uniref:Uncharacterized protein n=1 Tax=Caerostris extrusa TaxID=172846 RepID=A0AAV4RFU1_CAEEX|nr:hypothetical protein CEXT_569551 [Caerostris extrusa]
MHQHCAIAIINHKVEQRPEKGTNFQEPQRTAVFLFLSPVEGHLGRFVKPITISVLEIVRFGITFLSSENNVLFITNLNTKNRFVIIGGIILLFTHYLAVLKKKTKKNNALLPQSLCGGRSDVPHSYLPRTVERRSGQRRGHSCSPGEKRGAARPARIHHSDRGFSRSAPTLGHLPLLTSALLCYGETESNEQGERTRKAVSYLNKESTSHSSRSAIGCASFCFRMGEKKALNFRNAL